jgi:hypothetical protein
LFLVNLLFGAFPGKEIGSSLLHIVDQLIKLFGQFLL